jgi:hypothetical protein
VGSFGLTIRTLDASCECEKPMECAEDARAQRPTSTRDEVTARLLTLWDPPRF